MASENTPDPRVKWALDILDYGGIETVPVYRHYGVPILSTLAGFASVAYANVVNHRPYYSRGGYLIGASLLGLFTGLFGRDYLTFKMSEREAVLKDYLIRHPELFPEPERKKYGDPCVILPWTLRR